MPKYVFNPETLSFEAAADEPRALKILRRALVVAAAAGTAFLYFWIYTSVLGWDLPKTAALKRRAAAWESRVTVLEKRLDQYSSVLSGIEQRDDEVYRSIYGLNPIPAEIRDSGLEGVNRYAEYDEYGASQDLRSCAIHIDGLMKRVYLRSRALDEVGQISRNAGDMLSCVPSVPPLLPDPGQFHMTSYFGFRTDPVYGGTRHHEGVDFGGKRGYPVYVTGDGVVEFVEFRFSGYGNQVVVDHGFGYKTRYAHLDEIKVAPGAKLRRGQQLGTLGNSGKSTGPHLHYEVIYMGRHVNPMTYMDISMPVDEYRAMVEDRRSENGSDRRISTTELLRRGRASGE